MEVHKSKCLECNTVYKWNGYKTGIGKTEAQLLKMAYNDHTCRYCKSKTLKTGLDWDGHPNQPDISDYDQTILTDYEIKASREDGLSIIDPSIYECRNCKGNYFTPVRRWKDTDGEFILLYCMDCKIRTAVPFEQNNDDVITDEEMQPSSAVNFAASLFKPPPSAEVEDKKATPIPPSDPKADPIRFTLYINEKPSFYNREDRENMIQRIFSAVQEYEGCELPSLTEKGFTYEKLRERFTEIINNLDKRPPRVTPIKVNVYKSSITQSITSEFIDSDFRFKSGSVGEVTKVTEMSVRVVADVVKFKPGDIVRFTRRATKRFPSTPDIGQIIKIRPIENDKDNRVEYGIMSSILDGENDQRVKDMLYYANDSEIIELVERRSLYS